MKARVSISFLFERFRRIFTMRKEFLFRVAGQMDYDEILHFVREYYYKEEPLTLAHPEQGHTKDDEEFTMSHIIHKTVLLAIDEENEKIVGVLIAGPIEHGDADKMLENAEFCESKKWSDISKFLAYIEKKADVLGKFNLEEAVHCHALGVHHDYRGNKIGLKLFEKFFDVAKALNYQLVSVDCTSIFSNRICEQLEMDLVSSVSYDEYNMKIGEKLFKSIEPNTKIITYVKKL